MPATAIELPFSNVVIRQGVTPDLISVAESLLEGSISDHAKPIGADAQIVLESERNRVAFSYGNMQFSEMIWT